MKRLAILGASDHGKVVADIAEACEWGQIIFYDDNWPNCRRNGCWDVVGTTERMLESRLQFDGAIVAIGDNQIRQEKIILLREHGVPLVSLVHPSSTVSKRCHIGSGVVVMPGSVVNIDASIGDGAILNTGCVVDHDCVLGEFVHVSPGACLAGGVTIGNRSWVGIGASVRQKIAIGSNVIVGAGATVVRDIASDLVVAGVPATEIR